MKKIIISTWLIAALGLAMYAEGKVEEAAGATVDGDTSYAFGMVIGSELKQTGIAFNYNAFTRGVREILEDTDTNFSMDEAVKLVQTAFLEAMTKRAEENKAKEQEFLAENAKKAGVQATASGLQYEVIIEGSGEKPQASDTVLVHYRGTLTDGTVFDSSYDREEPAQFPLYAVIAGWTEGIQLMNEGACYRLYVPSGLAYGEQGAGSVIPPYSTLIFDVELLSILQTLDEEDDIEEEEE
ncbi:MAG: FKBP-type peptidyl-prolyl cis-trans isomerase [Treponema sp.]|jgi:FKBP-type peptidyl-prolyl cis-trans isomerase|nr:FKBP-type peptidyl-prolyl cis-trans isomerase [Treponema sp.]